MAFFKEDCKVFFCYQPQQTFHLSHIWLKTSRGYASVKLGLFYSCMKSKFFDSSKGIRLRASGCNNCNNVGSCFVCLQAAKSLTGFKLCVTTPNNTCRGIMQQGVQNEAQHVTSNHVGSCWPTMLRPFARDLISRLAAMYSTKLISRVIFKCKLFLVLNFNEISKFYLICHSPSMQLLLFIISDSPPSDFLKTCS